MVVWKGGLPIDDFLKFHGVEKLFQGFSLILFQRIRYNSFADSLLFIVLKYRLTIPFSGNTLQEHLHDLSKIGTILMKTPTPWIKISVEYKTDFRFMMNDILRRQNMKSQKVRKVQNLPDDFINDPNALFGAFALMGIALEELGETGDEEKELIESILSTRIPFTDYINIILKARIEEIELPNIKDDLSKLNFATEQQDLILKWIQREVTFTRKLKSKMVRSASLT